MALKQGLVPRFCSDDLACGRQSGRTALIDDFRHECLALVAVASLAGAHVGQELDATFATRGKPLVIASANSLT